MVESSTAKRADFRAAFERDGAAKVAGFLAPNELALLRGAVDACYELLQQRVDDDPPTLNEHLVDHYKRWNGIWMKELRIYLAAARPDLLRQVDGAIDAAQRRFRALFGQRWRLEPNFTFVRRIRTSRRFLQWHIDADAAGITTATDYCINTWLPLDPVGDELPSLELIPGSNKIMPHVPSVEGSDKKRSEEWVKSNVAGEPWIPSAVPGDAIVFDHWTLHRTQRIERESLVRTSCEFRFVRMTLAQRIKESFIRG